MTAPDRDSQSQLQDRLQRLSTGVVKLRRPRLGPVALALGSGTLGLAAGVYIVLAAPDFGAAPAPVATSSAVEFAGGATGLEGFAVAAAPEPPPLPPPSPSPEIARLKAEVQTLNARIAELQKTPRTVSVPDTAALTRLRDALHTLQDDIAGKDQALTAAEGQNADLASQLADAQAALAAQKALDAETARAESDQVARDTARQRQEAEAAARQAAQVNSAMVAWRGSAGATAAGETAADTGEDAPGSDAFLRASARPVAMRQAQVIADPGHTIIQGTVIAAALETAINSDLPGAVSAVVSSDVWSFDMSRVLIPRGSKLFGRYDSDLGPGARRIRIAWTRIVTTDGQSVDLAADGSDAVGRAGLPADVRTHGLAKFGAATLLSLIGAVPDHAAAKARNGSGSLIRDLGGNVQNATTDAVGAYLAIKPTLSTDQGAVVMVRVDSDLAFPW